MMESTPLLLRQARQIIRLAIQEDLAYGDVTTDTLISSALQAEAHIRACQELTVAGVVVAQEVFREIDPNLQITRDCVDGQGVSVDQSLLTIRGTARSILAGERVALNFLQHLSGIASLTNKFCEAVRGYPAKIFDTRKTTPGLRLLQKWAVQIGGGHNHRFSLSDGVLIKDNHLLLLDAQNISISQACRQARAKGPHNLRITVEVETLNQVREALDGAADVILLDNMSPQHVRNAVELVKGRAQVEVSGGVSLENVREFAAAGADFISIGALTHSAPAVDIHLEFTQSPHQKNRNQ